MGKRKLTIETARVFRPLLTAARYKGARGGRGSGKSHFFGESLVEYHLMERGSFSVCIREIQTSLAQSSKRLVESKIKKFGLESAGFKIYEEKIKTPGDGLIIFIGMQDHTADTILSLEGANRAWIEQAERLSHRSLDLLRPTIRSPKSEIWASWNPTRKTDAIDVFLRQNPPPGAIEVEANWRDNPWWTPELEAERVYDLENNPENYDHKWEGAYATAFKGAYFAKALAKAKDDGRICNLSADPLLPLRAFWDIGGAGAKADAMAIWIVQWVQERILVLDYCEGVGQVLAYYVNWLRENGYEKAVNYLPHDGIVTNNVTGKKYVDHLREADLQVEPPIANMGAGAAALRIEAVRRLGNKLWFDEVKTEAGRTALGFYHEKIDDRRNIGLGPDHDWSSHCADAFGLMAVCYREPVRSARFNRPLDDHFPVVRVA
jgi:phage terminase large subunit